MVEGLVVITNFSVVQLELQISCKSLYSLRITEEWGRVLGGAEVAT